MQTDSVSDALEYTSYDVHRRPSPLVTPVAVKAAAHVLHFGGPVLVLLTRAEVQVMSNLKAILEEAGGTFENIVKTTVLLDSMADFAAVNTIYGANVHENRFACCCWTVHVPIAVRCQVVQAGSRQLGLGCHSSPFHTSRTDRPANPQ